MRNGNITDCLSQTWCYLQKYNSPATKQRFDNTLLRLRLYSRDFLFSFMQHSNEGPLLRSSRDTEARLYSHLIGQYWSRDLDAGLSLVSNSHVTSILASHWSLVLILTSHWPGSARRASVTSWPRPTPPTGCSAWPGRWPTCSLGTILYRGLIMWIISYCMKQQCTSMNSWPSV